jgi:hypothetical protein
MRHGSDRTAPRPGKELWVALLEKAFAKFVGSYHTLDGGHMLYGLQVLTSSPPVVA